MKIAEVYNKFCQPPMLVQHQLRVASVGMIIFNALNISEDDAIKALLVHDLGNIVRLKFGLFDKDAYGKLGAEFYKSKKEEFIKKYGNIDHEVTVKMLREINTSERIIQMVESVNWENIESATKSNDMILKVLNYSDMRVGPFGILAATERIDEVNKRKENWPEYQLIRNKVILLEKQIFENASISSTDIIDNNIANIIEKLKQWNL